MFACSVFRQPVSFKKLCQQQHCKISCKVSGLRRPVTDCVDKKGGRNGSDSNGGAAVPVLLRWAVAGTGQRRGVAASRSAVP